MKLKYYLRGLGIGMVVTALLMGISTPAGETLSDTQIKQRAAELGMVDSSALTLAEQQLLQETAEETLSAAPEETAAVETEPAAEPVQTEESAEENTEESTEENIEESTEENIKESAESANESTEESTEEAQTVEIVIQRGDTSASVSRKLEEAGLIQDSGTYDRYLCDNGYATGIIAGTYTISPDKSEEEIAKIITRKE